jgi:hypothetical protein
LNKLLRQVAKVVIAEDTGKRVCPGEERCGTFQSSVDAGVCEKCPRNQVKTKVFSIEGANAVLPWLFHLIYLYGLTKVGATFLINDLTKEEWDGLLMLDSVKNEIEHEKYEAERLKQKAEAAVASSRRGKR